MDVCYHSWVGWWGIVVYCRPHEGRQRPRFGIFLPKILPGLFSNVVSCLLLLQCLCKQVRMVRCYSPFWKCCLANRLQSLVLNASPVTCKIGLKRPVCAWVSAPRPRHAFPETGCAVNIRTMESLINNTRVTDTITDQAWGGKRLLSGIQVPFTVWGTTYFFCGS